MNSDRGLSLWMSKRLSRASCRVDGLAFPFTARRGPGWKRASPTRYGPCGRGTVTRLTSCSGEGRQGSAECGEALPNRALQRTGLRPAAERDNVRQTRRHTSVGGSRLARLAAHTDRHDAVRLGGIRARLFSGRRGERAAPGQVSRRATEGRRCRPPGGRPLASGPNFWRRPFKSGSDQRLGSSDHPTMLAPSPSMLRGGVGQPSWPRGTYQCALHRRRRGAGRELRTRGFHDGQCGAGNVSRRHGQEVSLPKAPRRWPGQPVVHVRLRTVSKGRPSFSPIIGRVECPYMCDADRWRAQPREPRDPRVRFEGAALSGRAA